MTNLQSIVSGMGLAVTQPLVSRGDWHIHLVDLNAERGATAASSIGPSASFHQTNIASHDSLASTSKQVYKTQKRINFVPTNAGIAEHANFYATHDADPPPPVAGLDPIMDIDLKSVVSTSYLALHYFCKSPDVKDKCPPWPRAAEAFIPAITRRYTRLRSTGSSVSCAALHSISGFRTRSELMLSVLAW